MIKFRAWDEESQRMFNIARFDFADYTVYSHLFACDGYLGENLEIMQYTGLEDKNGVETFEGDVVKNDSVPNPFISNKYFEIIRARSGEWRMDNYRGGQVLSFGNHEVEIIGNKFENRELLEEWLG